jgi:hypothetical protein
MTAPTGLLPLVFAHDSPKKFLAFSTNLTRVVADINGGLSQTQNSFLSAASYGDPIPYGESGPCADDEADQSVPSSVTPESHAVAFVTPLSAVIRPEGASAITSHLSTPL